jgi:hypothetical protein
MVGPDFELRSRLEDFCRHNENLDKAMDTIPQLEAIARRAVNCPFPIAIAGRRVLLQGEAKKRCRRDICRREIFLFSDLFVYAQKKGKQLWAMADYPLAQLRVALLADGKCLSFYTPKKSFVLEFKSVEECGAWNGAIAAATQRDIEGREDGDTGVIEAPIWVPGKAAKSCMGCKAAFTKIRRKHHCRSCGNVYCAECLDKRMIMPRMSEKPVKCCAACFKKREPDTRTWKSNHEI